MRINYPINVLVRLIVAFFIIIEYLPIMKLLPNHLYYGSRIIFVAIFFIIVAYKNFKDFTQYFMLFFISIVVETYIYTHNFTRLFVYEAYIIPAMLCFAYMMIGDYFYKNSSRFDKNIIYHIFIILAMVTSITTLNGLSYDPFAVRALGNGGAGLLYDNTFYYRLNVATWGIIYGFTFLLPALVIRFKRERKLITLITIVLVELVILSSQIMFAIIFSFMLLFVSMFNMTSTKKIITISCFVAFSAIALYSFREDVFFLSMDVLSSLGNEKTALRLSQVYTLIDSGVATGDADARFDLYMMSLNTFLDNPILGFDDSTEILHKNIGNHSQIFDMLAASGFIFTGLWIASLIFLIKRIAVSIRSREVKIYYYMISIVFFILLFLNPMVFNPGLFYVLSLLPSFFPDDTSKL